MLCNIERALGLINWMNRNKILPNCVVIKCAQEIETSSRVVNIQHDERFSPAAQVMDVLSDIEAKCDDTELAVSDIYITSADTAKLDKLIIEVTGYTPSA